MEQIQNPNASTGDSLSDPLVTANLYCSRRLDELLREAVAPMWSRIQAEWGAQGVFLWFSRYARRGEHLKVRLHAPASLREPLRAMLEQAATAFFATRPPAQGAERLINNRIPPVDVEDAQEKDAPDCSLEWTSYRRSPVIMGADIYVRDDRHAALFTAALGECAKVVLAELAPEPEGPALAQKRQSLFIKLLIAGIAETGLSSAEWVAYHTYHRDWVVRYVVSTGDSRKVQQEGVLEELEQKVSKVGAAVKTLGELMAAQQEAARKGSLEGPLAGWRSAMAAYARYLADYRGRPEYDVDPYTRDFTFLPLFKVLQGCANQCGFRLSNEAYLHHMLLRAAQQLPGAAG